MYNLAIQSVNALSLGGTYALLALGLALGFSIMGMVNFAHGELMTICGYTVFFALALGFGFVPAALLGLVAAGIAGWLMEAIAFRPVRGSGLGIMLLTSFAVSIMLKVVFQNAISARPKAIPIPSWLEGTLSLGNLNIGVIQAISIFTTLLMMALLVALLKWTKLGMAMRAAALDFQVTRLMGFNANSVIGVTFGLSGLLAGVAGLLWIAQRGSVDPLMGFLPTTKAFIACVLGGLGSLVGAVVGGFALAAIEVALRAGLPDRWLPFREAISLGIVIAILVMRPAGLISGGQKAPLDQKAF